MVNIIDSSWTERLKQSEADSSTLHRSASLFLSNEAGEAFKCRCKRQRSVAAEPTAAENIKNRRERGSASDSSSTPASFSAVGLLRYGNEEVIKALLLWTPPPRSLPGRCASSQKLQPTSSHH